MGIPVMQMIFYVDEIAILDNGSPSALIPPNPGNDKCTQRMATLAGTPSEKDFFTELLHEAS